MRIVFKIFGIVSRVGCLAGTANSGDGGKGFYVEPVRYAKFTACVVPFVVERSKIIGSQDGLGASEHHAHGFFIVLVGEFVVDEQFVFGIDGGLQGVAYFGDGTAYDLMAAVGIRCR